MAITRISQSSIKEGLEKFNSFYAGLSGAFIGNYESIATVTVGSGGASSITFSNLPSGFQHVQIRACLRGTSADYFGNINVYLNSDTGNNYSRHTLYGDGVSAGAAGVASTTFLFVTRTGSSTLTSNFAPNIVDILDYGSTSKNKTIRAFTGFDDNARGPNNADKGFVSCSSGLWMNTAAVTSIQLTPVTGNLVEFSTAALYGLRAP